MTCRIYKLKHFLYRVFLKKNFKFNFLYIFIYFFTCTNLLSDVDEVRSLGTMGDSCHILVRSERWEGERHFSLSNIPISVMEDAPQPALDFTFSPSNSQRQQQDCWQGHWIWASWKRKKLVYINASYHLKQDKKLTNLTPQINPCGRS